MGYHKTYFSGQPSIIGGQRAIDAGYLPPTQRDGCCNCVHGEAHANRSSLMCVKHRIYVHKTGICPSYHKEAPNGSQRNDEAIPANSV